MATPEQWPKIKEIVGEALDRPPDDRPAFLDQACSHDSALRAEVESLLAAHAEADGLSANPWASTVADPVGESKIIGPYRLVHRLGVGGMGQVWLAEQTDPVRRRVALKLIRAGMYDAALVQRFQSERQSLAIMEHPSIAKVFDAGATSEGQPYLAMEFVDGLPITEYCDRKKLNIRNRLRLFIQVCEGVQHAHQKAIIHRDLKPSNILVTEIDGKPQPRIIDFGLAKATAPHALGETMYTHRGAFLGTPGYMSPEQSDPAVYDIDTRTDVYSLGVILYELLTGCLPFDTTLWKKQSLDQILQQLRESDAPRPSTKVARSRDTSTARAEARSTEPAQWAGLLRGDLDWITLKALEKERDRRYATPAALAADIANFLTSRPVEARPASAAYRLRKYVRRHALAMTLTSVSAALLVAFAVMQSIELRRITRERDRADRITEFMTSMFKVSDPSEARGNTITAREILDKSSREIDTGLSRDPELRAQMLEIMGRVYLNLGLYAQAEPLLKQAVDIQQRTLGPENASTLESANLLVKNLVSSGKYPEAEKSARELVDVETRVLGPASRTTLMAKANLAWVLDDDGKVAEAGAVCRETLPQMQQVLGKNDPDTLASTYRCAVNLFSQGLYTEAEKLDREAIEIEKAVFGKDDYRTLLTMSDLGVELVWQRRDVEGEQILRQTLEQQSRILGAKHQNTIATADALGTALMHEQRYPEAERQFHETLDNERTALGPDHPAVLMTEGNLASVLAFEQKFSQAEQLLREVYEKRRRILGPDHPDCALALYDLGDILSRDRRYPEAASCYRQAMDINRRVLGPDHPETTDSAYNLARVLALAGKREESLSILGDAVEHHLSTVSLADLQNAADWNSLRADPRFRALLGKAQNQSETKGKPR